MPAAGRPVGPVDLEHDLALIAKEAGQGGAVAAGALHTPGVDLAEPPGLGEQVPVAGGGGRDADHGQAAAECVLGVGDVDVQVGIDPDGDARPLQLCDGGDAVSLL